MGGVTGRAAGLSELSPQACDFSAKDFQEPKINVNLRPPGHVNRAIMELYTPTHTHRGDTHLTKEEIHNKYSYTHTNGAQGSHVL